MQVLTFSFNLYGQFRGSNANVLRMLAVRVRDTAPVMRNLQPAQN